MWAHGTPGSTAAPEPQVPGSSPPRGIARTRRRAAWGAQIRHAAPFSVRRPHPEPTVKGDQVEIVIDTGGATKNYEVAATRAGRRVEVVTAAGWWRSPSSPAAARPCGPPGSWPAACSPWWSTPPTVAAGAARARRPRPRSGRNNAPGPVAAAPGCALCPAGPVSPAETGGKLARRYVVLPPPWPPGPLAATIGYMTAQAARRPGTRALAWRWPGSSCWSSPGRWCCSRSTRG